MPQTSKPKRKYRQVVRAVFDRPWAITPDKFEAMINLVELRAAGQELTEDEIQAAIGGLSRPSSSQSYKSIAVLDLFGVVAQRMGMMERVSGGTSLESFSKAFRAAVEDDNVARIVLHVDSPGGSVFGTQELAAEIQAARGKKPITAVIDSLGASAAYWIASQADEVIATPGAQVGSIGVLAVHVDPSAAYEEEGIRHQVMAIPEAKGDGVAGPLSEEGVEHRMNTVTAIYEQFTGAVAAGRGVSVEKVKSDFGGGRVLTAENALRAGMVDRIATYAEVMQEFGVGSVQSTESARETDAPFLSFEEWSMKPEIFGALCMAGMVQITASESEAERALDRFFAAHGVAKPDDDDQILAFLKEKTAKVDPPAKKETVAQTETASESAAAEIVAAVRLSKVPADRQMDLAAELVNSNADMGAVLRRIESEVAESEATAGATVLRPGAASIDKFRAEAKQAINSRFLSTTGIRAATQIWDRREQEYVEFNPGSRNRRLQSLMGLAEASLQVAGVPQRTIDQMEKFQIAQVAMGLKQPSDFGFFAAADGPAYNTTGDFSNILLDAMHVMLRRSYDDANTTFQAWMRQAPSLSDFRDVHKVIAGELSDPKAIPEDGEFTETTMSDSKEKYSLTVWGHVWSISWQAVVNDQLSAFTEAPVKMGRAMRRKQNRLAYNVLKDNDALQADSVALFHASHSNLTTGAGAPSVTTLNSLTTSLMQQTGLDSDSGFLNLMPRYLIAPPALRGTVLELLASIANPAAGGSAAGSSGVANIWQNGLEPVIEAELGASATSGSDTAWYLACDPSDVDTIEYAYLQGLESPAMEQEVAFDRLALRERCYQAFAVKAIDYRGLQKHAGV